jgi:cyclohexadienyl dehydratase
MFNQKIKRVVAFLIIAFVAGGILSGFAQSRRSGLQEILERGTLRVGTTGDFNPFSFKDPRTGEYSGHDIELVTKLAADMGVDVEFVATDWRNLVNGVSAGKYDITTGASYNMGRAKTAGYTLPVIEVGTVPVIQRRDANRFRSWDDIDADGITVAVTLGTVFDDQAKALFENADIKRVEPPARDYQEVLAGRTPVSLTSTFEASALVKQYSQLAIAAVDAPVFQNAIGILVAQDDQILINYINVWITMQRYNGYLAQLKAKWLPELKF